MTIQQALETATKRLTKSKSQSPQLDAEVLLAHVLGKDKAFLFTYPETKLTTKQVEKYQGLVSKRVLNRPIAYLTNKKEFYKLNFYINKHVLIPRPLTEELVSKAEEYLRKHKGLHVLDLGTGSGAIVIALAKNLGDRHTFYASDKSPKALDIAKRNAKTHNVKVSFKQSDLLKGWKNHFDVMVVNLPYLAKLTDPATKHEPKVALLSPKAGLGHYLELLKQISERPTKPKRMFMEMHVRQRHKILPEIKRHLPGIETTIVWDSNNS